MCPFPFDLVRQEIEKYPNAKLIWTQEEHKNQGYWCYIQPHVETVTNHERHIRYKKNFFSSLHAYKWVSHE